MANENIFVAKNGINALGVLLSSGQDLFNLFSGSAAQTLQFNSDSGNLTISPGNTVSLSALSAQRLFLPYLPLSGGVVTGNLNINAALSSLNVVYASGGNSNQWNQAYSNFTWLTGNSGAGGTVFSLPTTITANSAYWQASYSALTATSAQWNDAFYRSTIYTVNSAKYEAASAGFNTTSARNTIVYSILTGASAYWNTGYSVLTSNSAYWNRAYSNFTWLTGNSGAGGTPFSLPTTVTSATAYWNTGYSALTSNSAYWNQAYSNFTWLTGNSGAGGTPFSLPTTVTTNSAYWQAGYSSLTATSGFWNQAYSNFTWLTGNSGVSGSGNVPAGGTTGQALVKSSAADYATTWETLQKFISSGTAAPTGGIDGDIYLQYV